MHCACDLLRLTAADRQGRVGTNPGNSAVNLPDSLAFGTVILLITRAKTHEGGRSATPHWRILEGGKEFRWTI